MGLLNLKIQRLLLKINSLAWPDPRGMGVKGFGRKKFKKMLHEKFDIWRIS
jgi:hypothetical protein